MLRTFPSTRLTFVCIVRIGCNWWSQNLPAVKGCYERNFVVFKQIYAFECLHPACNKPTSMLTARCIVSVSTNAEFTLLVRRAFMWATYLLGSWTTGTGWDGMRHSILCKSLLPQFEKKKDTKHFNRISKTSSRWHGDPNVCRPPHVHDRWAHLRCPFSMPKRMNLRRSPRCARTVPHFKRTYDKLLFISPGSW